MAARLYQANRKMKQVEYLAEKARELEQMNQTLKGLTEEQDRYYDSELMRLVELGDEEEAIEGELEDKRKEVDALFLENAGSRGWASYSWSNLKPLYRALVVDPYRESGFKVAYELEEIARRIKADKTKELKQQLESVRSAIGLVYATKHSEATKTLRQYAEEIDQTTRQISWLKQHIETYKDIAAFRSLARDRARSEENQAQRERENRRTEEIRAQVLAVVKSQGIVVPEEEVEK